jgi:hypothetical protein
MLLSDVKAPIFDLRSAVTFGVLSSVYDRVLREVGKLHRTLSSWGTSGFA